MNKPQEKNEQEEEKIAYQCGKSYDFWNSEEDSIYDKLYGDEV